MYCRFLTLLWSGRHCPGLGVTDFLLDRSMELSMSYLEAMSVDDAALIVQDAVPGNLWCLGLSLFSVLCSIH